MRAARMLTFVFVLTLQQLFAVCHCVSAKSTTAAAAEQQQQEVPHAGLGLGTRCTKVPTYLGYMSPAAHDYRPLTQQPCSATAAPTSMAADPSLPVADSTLPAMAAGVARARRRRQRRRRLQANGQRPEHLAEGPADLVTPGMPAAAGGAGSSSSGSSFGHRTSSNGNTQGTAAARQRRRQQQQQQQKAGQPAAEFGSDQGSLQAPQSASGQPGSHSSSSQPGNAAPQKATGSSVSNQAVAAGASKRPNGRGHPLPGLPVDARPPGPKPPCNSSRGFVEQDGACVCMAGYGAAARAPNLCVPCLLGWFSTGGALGSARCRRCQDGTTSNPTRTACGELAATCQQLRPSPGPAACHAACGSAAVVG
ncbi:hypothetical protein COO60DRAFT_411308 [Scenedesmus sp. NREL 46B-D3]|nr:hypothetical protein COO60DRAFT_411308 [Scenedesmus sp. NREL 46B-D3]